MKGEWLRKPTASTTVVFLHGILSSGETCWKHENGAFWPELVKNQAELVAAGIYVFTYQTDIFSSTYSLSDVVDALRELLQLDEVLASKKLIFVCHSMGGIVARRFLVQQTVPLLEAQAEVGLFLVASPSLGSSYANWLSPLASALGHTQADALRFAQNNVWLNDLDKDFLSLKEAGKLAIKGKELIEDKFVTLKKLWRKQVVEPFAGARYFGEPVKIPHSDHFSIAKPENAQALQHRLLCKFIKDYFLSLHKSTSSQQATSVDTSPDTVPNGVTTAPDTRPSLKSTLAKDHQDSSAETYSLWRWVRIIIVDNRSASPIEEAEIEISNEKTRKPYKGVSSALGGDFHLDLEIGSYDVTVTHAQYHTQTLPLVVTKEKEDGPQTRQITLQRKREHNQYSR